MGQFLYNKTIKYDQIRTFRIGWNILLATGYISYPFTWIYPFLERVNGL